ncbi:MAG: DegT/DnrJ/EryC1/StrS family aminotransferase [Candidatus Krumholzibacteria bacterium]|nr:DegT/DnrJ/EryC1/StrS family aminotransferase [Candidatus Krumholzibacteria bacterium]
MPVPFVDLKAQYASIKPDIDAAIAGVVESCQFVGGDAVRRFESNFADYCGASHAVGASSGTSALHLALVGLGVGPGDEVITACNTFIATAEAITHAGARVVLVDVEEDTQLIDPAAVEAAITPRTKAVIPVHLYGQPADMDAIRTIASRHALKIVADAAQAHGAAIDGDRRKILGDATAYSFYPGKNLGAYGDAGMVVTDDEALATLMRALADHGSRQKYHHFAEGWNYRLDGVQAAVLDVKLAHLEQWTERRRSRAARYDRHFAGTPARPVACAPGRRHVYHLYVVRVGDRDGLGAALREKGIASGIHYPVPLHMQEAYRHLGMTGGACPVAEKVVAEIVSLPMYPELTDEMVDEVAAAVLDFVS